MQSPPRRTVKELLLHMANELKALLSVIPKKSRNIFQNFLVARQRSENVENGVCPLNWPMNGVKPARKTAGKPSRKTAGKPAKKTAGRHN